MSKSQPSGPPKDQPAPYHHGNLRATLLAAAEAELVEKGMEGLSLRSIAKRAGVSHAAPAHHFGDVNGLLTGLAASGFERFVAMQHAREAKAASDPRTQLAAAGLGYIDFALAHPALFRLMFSSARPSFEDPALAEAATAGFDHLVQNVREVRGRDPYQDNAAMVDVMAAWALVHGLADLLNTGRLKFMLTLPEDQRDDMISGMIYRLVPNL